MMLPLSWSSGARMLMRGLGGVRLDPKVAKGDCCSTSNGKDHDELLNSFSFDQLMSILAYHLACFEYRCSSVRPSGTAYLS